MTEHRPASGELNDAALFFHKFPRPGKLEIQATKPLGNQRDLALAYSPGVAAPCLAIAADPGLVSDYTVARQPRRRHHQRDRGARPRQYRRARRQAGDGGQGRPLQEIRRHRRLRHRGGRNRRRALRQRGRAARADFRRHQPRGHQGAGVLRHRRQAPGADEHPGLPRRPARHGDHRRRRGQERAPSRGQGDRRRQDRGFRGRCGGPRLPQPPRQPRGAAREHFRQRHRGRGLSRPDDADGPLESGLCAGHGGTHPRRGDRRRRHFPRSLRRRCADAGDGRPHGRQAAHPRACQSDARNHAGCGARRTAGRDDLHRALATSPTRSTTSSASRSCSAALSTSAPPRSTKS